MVSRKDDVTALVHRAREEGMIKGMGFSKNSQWLWKS